MSRIKKNIAFLLVAIFIMSVGLTSCKTEKKPKGIAILKNEEILELESRKSFDFFWNEANHDETSKGYGLIHDRAPGNKGVASIASVGFGLSALVIGVERDYVSHTAAEERAEKTIDTLLNNAEHLNGFFYHFLDMNSGKRVWNCEVSVIDTAIAICGAITAGEFFGGEVKEKAIELYKRVDWEWFRDKDKNMFYMGYTPERGFEGWWDFYAEQLMMYFLGAASPTHPVNSDMFYDFKRNYGKYGSYPAFINSWLGSIFTYQFSHAWFDMKGKVDLNGVDWWTNSVLGSKTNREYCIDRSDKYKTFGPDSWGLTASDGPNGYSGKYGAYPSGLSNDQNKIDGTVPPAGAAGSIVFTPIESISALNNYYKNYKDLWGKYGFKDAYNIDKSPEWYGNDVIGIDKGITLLMIENYRTGLIWDLFMKNEYVQSGMSRVGLMDIGTMIIDDFESGEISSGWDANNSSFDYQVVNNEKEKGIYSLKIKPKLNKTDGNGIRIVLNEKIDMGYDSLRLSIKGDCSLDIKLKDSNNDSLIEESYDIKAKDSWSQITMDISKIEGKLNEISTIELIPQITDSNINGEIYIDNLTLLESNPIAYSLYIQGKLDVGETLEGNYMYASSKSLREGTSRYNWYISESPDFGFELIKGADTKNYKLKPEDSGKYIRFQVTPVAKDGFEIGKPSITSGTYKVKGKSKKSEEIKKPQLVIDDFDKNNLASNWKDNGDNVYKLIHSNQSIKGKSLKIEYNKQGNEWAFFSYTLDTLLDFSKYNKLILNIKGTQSFIIKFENSKGEGVGEKNISLSNEDKWNEVNWDYENISKDCKDIKRVLFFIMPGQGLGNGEMYLDNIRLIKE